jgi:hypothetical protein
MKTILAALLATALALPVVAQHRDTELRRMTLSERNAVLTGPDYQGLVGRRDYDPGTIDEPPAGAGFGQNPYRGFTHSEDFGKVQIYLMSWRASERRWVDTIGGLYAELIDIGDQGTDAVIRLSALNKDGVRYTVRGGELRIEGGGWRLNRNKLVLRYEGFLRGARLDIVTGPGKIPTGDDPGARGNGDGFLFAVWGRADCLPTETNRLTATRTLAR